MAMPSVGGVRFSVIDVTSTDTLADSDAHRDLQHTSHQRELGSCWEFGSFNKVSKDGPKQRPPTGSGGSMRLTLR